MPFTTMVKIKNIDPLEIDPAQFRIAIRADERISIREGGATVSLKLDAEDGSLHIDDTYIIEIIADPILTPELIDGMRPGEAVTVLQLSDSDARKMARVQSLLIPFTEGERAGSLSFGVDISGVCTHSPIPPGKVPVDIFMQASDSDGFFVFNRNLDLRGIAGGAGAELASLHGCVESPVGRDRDVTESALSAQSGVGVHVG